MDWLNAGSLVTQPAALPAALPPSTPPTSSPSPPATPPASPSSPKHRRHWFFPHLARRPLYVGAVKF